MYGQTSKTLNYLDSIIVGPYFAFFIGAWIYLRHYLNLRILWATLTEFRTVGPFDLNWETQQYKCWISQVITFSLLACLQAVNLFWLFLILRIAKNYVFSSEVRDERSDSEDSEEEEEINEKEVHRTLEKDTGMKTDKPVLLVNGKPTDPVAKSEGIRDRKKAR
jgi:acyl-CoA-dependent ceramide synthase